MAKNVVWMALAVLLLIAIGALVISLLGTLLKLVFYLIVGAAVVWAAFYVYGKLKRNGQPR